MKSEGSTVSYPRDSLSTRVESSPTTQESVADKPKTMRFAGREEVEEEEEEEEVEEPTEERPEGPFEGRISYEEYEEDERIVDPGLKGQTAPSAFSVPRKWKYSQPTSPRRRRRKMTKKQGKKAVDKEQAATAAAEAEGNRRQMIQQMQEEIRLEEYNEKRNAQLEAERAKIREAQLRDTMKILRGYERLFKRSIQVSYEKENWHRYLTCDGLPDPGNLPDMNRYMYLWWVEDEEQVSMISVTEKCHVVIYLLAKLDEILRFNTLLNSGLGGGADSGTTMPRLRSEAEWRAVGRRLKERLQRWIDMACYRLLRRIETDMVREGTRTARYVYTSDRFVCCIWAPIALPIGTAKTAERDRKPIEIQFPELELTVKMPNDISCHRMAIRGLWLEYDHYSEDARSWPMPRIPEGYQSDTDTLEFCRNEYREKLKIREEQAEGRRLRLEEKKAILDRIENPPPVTVEKRGKQSKRQGGQSGKSRRGEADTEVEPEQEELPYLPTPDEIILGREDEARRELRKLLFARCEKTEVNLRKYRILGGVFRVDLIYQPPQPKETEKNISLTTLRIPKEPRLVPFYRPYEAPPPAPDSERTPEVIEAEMKALETAMEALVLVTLKLPSKVLWFEPPLVCHWIPEKSLWSTKDVHDIKYNEEKQTIAFRTGRLGIHGLAAFKFANLPFQSWELKPEMGRTARGGVALSVTAATVQAEFIVREDTVCLNSLAGGTSPALKDILGEYMSLHHLIERMRAAGCDLFPERDAASYLKGIATKHPVAEAHLRKCMSLLCTAYSFSWSRWNGTRGYREIVLQFKELHSCLGKERTNLTLLVTPTQATVVRCIEVSPEFSDVPIDGEEGKFYADLYNLAQHKAGIKTRLLMEKVSFQLAMTVAQLLESTNVISMSS